MVQRALQGPVAGVVANPQLNLVDLSMRELTMLVSLVVLLIGLGLYPQPVIDAAALRCTRLKRPTSPWKTAPVPAGGTP